MGSQATQQSSWQHHLLILKLGISADHAYAKHSSTDSLYVSVQTRLRTVWQTRQSKTVSAAADLPLYVAFRVAADAQFRLILTGGLELLSCRLYSTAQEVPLSSVGMAVESDDELLTAIEEILRHHAHYAQTAESFGDDWAIRHHPSRTLTTIMASAKKQLTGAA